MKWRSILLLAGAMGPAVIRPAQAASPAPVDLEAVLAECLGEDKAGEAFSRLAPLALALVRKGDEADLRRLQEVHRYLVLAAVLAAKAGDAERLLGLARFYRGLDDGRFREVAHVYRHYLGNVYFALGLSAPKPERGRYFEMALARYNQVLRAQPTFLPTALCVMALLERGRKYGLLSDDRQVRTLIGQIYVSELSRPERLAEINALGVPPPETVSTAGLVAPAPRDREPEKDDGPGPTLASPEAFFMAALALHGKRGEVDAKNYVRGVQNLIFTYGVEVGSPLLDEVAAKLRARSPEDCRRFQKALWHVRGETGRILEETWAAQAKLPVLEALSLK